MKKPNQTIYSMACQELRRHRAKIRKYFILMQGRDVDWLSWTEGYRAGWKAHKAERP